MTEYWMPFLIWDRIYVETEACSVDNIEAWLMNEYGLEAVKTVNISGNDVFVWRPSEVIDDDECCYRVHDEKKLTLFLLRWM